MFIHETTLDITHSEMRLNLNDLTNDFGFVFLESAICSFSGKCSLGNKPR